MAATSAEIGTRWTLRCLVVAAGFDQTPCGTNWVGWKRKRENAGAEDVIGKLVKLGREVIAPERLKGFMMAPWAACDNREHTDFIKHGVDLFADALEGKIHG